MQFKLGSIKPIIGFSLVAPLILLYLYIFQSYRSESVSVSLNNIEEIRNLQVEPPLQKVNMRNRMPLNLTQKDEDKLTEGQVSDPEQNVDLDQADNRLQDYIKQHHLRPPLPVSYNLTKPLEDPVKNERQNRIVMKLLQKKSVVELLDDLNQQQHHRSQFDWFDESDAEQLKLTSNDDILKELSQSFQINLKRIQKSGNSCSNISLALKCGTTNGCGFGCNLCHKVGCLILSYGYNIPLIHDPKTGWPYTERWSKYLKDFGTDCPDSSFGRIIQFNWDDSRNQKPLAESSLKIGLGMPKKFMELLNQNHENSFLWILGQFTRPAFQLKPKTLKMIKRFRSSIGISDHDLKNRLLFGMHVRRTDKYKESKVVLNATHFMDEALKWRSQLNYNYTTPIIVYLASEDCHVVPEFRNMYESPEWTFVSGCHGNESYPNQWDRADQLFQILRDIYMLSQANHVICTYSSNVCRVLSMIRSFQSSDPNPETWIHSLDGTNQLFLQNAGTVSSSFRYV